MYNLRLNGAEWHRSDPKAPRLDKSEFKTVDEAINACMELGITQGAQTWSLGDDSVTQYACRYGGLKLNQDKNPYINVLDYVIASDVIQDNVSQDILEKAQVQYNLYTPPVVVPTEDGGMDWKKILMWVVIAIIILAILYVLFKDNKHVKKALKM